MKRAAAPKPYKVPAVRDVPRGTTTSFTELTVCACAQTWHDGSRQFATSDGLWQLNERGVVTREPWRGVPWRVGHACQFCAGTGTVEAKVTMTYRAATQLELDAESKPLKRAKRSQVAMPYVGAVELARQLELVGTAEIATRLHVGASAVSNWRRRGGFPKPLADLAQGPVWSWPIIENWARATKRLRAAS